MGGDLESGGLSRRNFLKGAAAAGAMAFGAEASAAEKARKKDLPPGFDSTVQAARELYGIDDESLERKERDHVISVLEQTKQRFRAMQRTPQDHDYRGALMDAFSAGNIGWFNTEKGKQYTKYFEEWKSQKR